MSDFWKGVIVGAALSLAIQTAPTWAVTTAPGHIAPPPGHNDGFGNYSASGRQDANAHEAMDQIAHRRAVSGRGSSPWG